MASRSLWRHCNELYWFRFFSFFGFDSIYDYNDLWRAEYFSGNIKVHFTVVTASSYKMSPFILWYISGFSHILITSHRGASLSGLIWILLLIWINSTWANLPIGYYCDDTFHITDQFNSLRPRQNGRHFADDIFKCIFLNDNIWIPINISLKFVPKGPINNIPALVQIMAWRRPGDKPLSKPMMVSLTTHIGVTRPQWVKENLLATNRLPHRKYETWWRHQMETFSALLAIWTGNSPVLREFPAQSPVTRSFNAFFNLRLNKRLSKQCEAGDWRRYRAHYDVIEMR